MLALCLDQACVLGNCTTEPHYLQCNLPVVSMLEKQLLTSSFALSNDFIVLTELMVPAHALIDAV